MSLIVDLSIRFVLLSLYDLRRLVTRSSQSLAERDLIAARISGR